MSTQFSNQTSIFAHTAPHAINFHGFSPPQEYLLEFTSEYGIPEGLHSKLPGPEETIVDFPEGKVGMYTKFFEFANFRIPISQFLFDILGDGPVQLNQCPQPLQSEDWDSAACRSRGAAVNCHRKPGNRDERSERGIRIFRDTIDR
ncbi:hypothetical protein Tco_0028347 [Tanacetum coccineum]